MLSAVFYIIAFYFLLGAAFTVIINKNKNDGKERSRWLKYGVYLFVVCAVVLSTRYQVLFSLLAAVILLVGVYELYRVFDYETGRSALIMSSGIVVFLFIGTGFYFFSSSGEPHEKLFVYTLVFTFDGFSQLSGQLFGKHRLAPRVSPNKTREGLIGGALMTMVTAVFLGQWMGSSLLSTCALATLLCTAGLAGDLLASYYKRINKVKDYGTLIPGHGGMLDRFDSFIAAGSTWWIFSNLTKLA